jgi:hypothetical protein
MAQTRTDLIPILGVKSGEPPIEVRLNPAQF